MSKNIDLLLPESDVELAELEKVLKYRWELHARPEQRPDPNGDWRRWVFLAGRGSGKTRSAVEMVREWITAGTYKRGHLIGPTASDVRDTMIEGESGIMSCFPDDFKPDYQPSRRRIVFPNGAICLLFSADEPERLRGPQCDFIWADEIASWRRPEAWDMAMFGLRLGDNPRAIVTGTPKPLKHVKEILKGNKVIVTRGNSYANRANLAPDFFDMLIEKYEGTRLGRQEIYAEMLDDNPSALWSRDMIELHRVSGLPKGVKIKRMAVALDPSIKGRDNTDLAGICVVGLGTNKHLYVFDDASLIGSPMTWAMQAVACYNRHDADIIIYEANQGGDMVPATLEKVEDNLPIKEVNASKGKYARAEPISAMYEKGKVHHVGVFSELEDEMCQWEPDIGMESPNRMDALVWGCSYLAGVDKKIFIGGGTDVRPD